LAYAVYDTGEGLMLKVRNADGQDAPTTIARATPYDRWADTTVAAILALEASEISTVPMERPIILRRPSDETILLIVA
jgi:hypothetical protein